MDINKVKVEAAAYYKERYADKVSEEYLAGVMSGVQYLDNLYREKYLLISLTPQQRENLIDSATFMVDCLKNIIEEEQ